MDHIRTQVGLDWIHLALDMDQLQNRMKKVGFKFHKIRCICLSASKVRL